jgi:hypothetical protein
MAAERQEQNIITGNEFPCDASEVKTFERSLFLSLAEEGLTWIVEQEQDLVLELSRAFQDTYNQQSFQSCDVPHFRTISSVTMETLEDEGGNGGGSILKMTVSAQCYKCIGSLTLFPAYRNQTNNEVTANSSITTYNALEEQIINNLFAVNKQLVPTTCTCNEGVVPNPNLISLDDFLRALNENWAAVMLVWSTNVTVESILEIQNIPCPAEKQTFTTIAFVDLGLGSDTVPSPTETRAIEDSFIRAYNTLSFATCDPSFRSVTNARLDLAYSDRKQKANEELSRDFSRYFPPASAAAPSPFTKGGVVAFNISGSCRNCLISDNVTSILFGNVFPMRARRLTASRQPRVASEESHLKKSLKQRIFSLDFSDIVLRRQLQQDYTCFCPTQSGTGIEDGMTLTQDAFLASLNMELTKLQEAGILGAVGVGVVQAVEEGQRVTCGETIVSFGSKVFSNLQVNVSSFTIEEARAIEEAFQETYNGLAYQSCDAYFRTVAKVELQVVPDETTEVDGVLRGRRLVEILRERNRLLSSENSNAASNSTNNRNELASTLFTVTGSCRDCPVTESGTFNLFDDDAIRRRELVVGKTHHIATIGKPKIRKLQQIGEGSSCICPFGVDPVIGAGPNSQDFEMTFNGKIADLQDDGEVTSILANSTNVVEGQSVLCNGEPRLFKSFVNADVGVDPSKLSEQTIETLEKIFQDTYNSLTFQACDDFFRVVSSVGVVAADEIDGRSLQGVGSANGGTASNSTVLLEVTGRCRNCPVNESGTFNLFDDALRRRSLIQSTVMPISTGQRKGFAATPQSRRNLQQALDLCFCPIGVEPGQVNITSRDFLVLFNKNIVNKTDDEAIKISLISLVEGLDATVSTAVPKTTSAPQTNEPESPPKGSNPSPADRPKTSSVSVPEETPKSQTRGPTLSPTKPATGSPTKRPSLPPRLGPSLSPTKRTTTAFPSNAQCQAAFEEYQAVYYLTFDGNITNLQDEFIASAWKTAYADLGPGVCDPQYKSVTVAARFTRRRLQQFKPQMAFNIQTLQTSPGNPFPAGATESIFVDSLNIVLDRNEVIGVKVSGFSTVLETIAPTSPPTSNPESIRPTTETKIPTRSPDSSIPTRAFETSLPTDAPETNSPTGVSETSSPTVDAATKSPTGPTQTPTHNNATPGTTSPTATSDTSSPTGATETSSPTGTTEIPTSNTLTPETTSPTATRRPVTSSPTDDAATSSPAGPTETSSPTGATATGSPDTSSPTGDAATNSPTGATETSSPTGAIETSSPTNNPATPETTSPTATGSPDTSSPTGDAATSSPTGPTETSSPTGTPATGSPDTSSPTVDAATSSPTGPTETSSPTGTTATGSPDTSSPTVDAATNSPTGATETSSPTGAIETSSPTNNPATPETTSPTSNRRPDTSIPTIDVATSSPTSNPATPETTSPTGSSDSSSPRGGTTSPTSNQETSSPSGSTGARNQVGAVETSSPIGAIIDTSSAYVPEFDAIISLTINIASPEAISPGTSDERSPTGAPSTSSLTGIPETSSRPSTGPTIRPIPSTEADSPTGSPDTSSPTGAPVGSSPPRTIDTSSAPSRGPMIRPMSTPETASPNGSPDATSVIDTPEADSPTSAPIASSLTETPETDSYTFRRRMIRTTTAVKMSSLRRAPEASKPPRAPVTSIITAKPRKA